MSDTLFSAAARNNEHIFRLLSRFLVALMLACGAQTFASLVGQVLPEWYPWYLSIFTFFTALACLAYAPRLKKLGPLSREWLMHLVTIWLVLLTSARLLIGLANGPAVFWNELRQWPQDPTLILSPEFFIVLMAGIFTWFLADIYADLLAKLDLDHVRMQQEYADPRETSAPPVRQRLLHLTIHIGIFLVSLTALMRLDLRAAAIDAELVIQQLPRLAGGGASTLLYFALALLLFSLARFMELQGRWSLNKIPTNSEMAGHWAQYSLFFLAVLTFLVALLPTHYSLGVLQFIGYALQTIIAALFFIVQLILSLFIRLVNLVFSALGQQEPLEEVPLPEMAPPEFIAQPVEETPTQESPPWLEILRQAFFWFILLAILFFSFRYILQSNSELLPSLRRFPFLALLSKLFERFFGFLRKTSASLTETIQSGIERLRPKRGLRQAAGDWINLRLLNPRRKVYFYYQAFLRRSSESGLPRSLSQTPSEFAQRLDIALPESEPDIETLTAAFIEARYTRREIPNESASLARRAWQGLRKALLARRKPL